MFDCIISGVGMMLNSRYLLILEFDVVKVNVMYLFI